MLVSIIIPCYNQGRFLNETLKSVLNQTYSNWECLIIDDGSTDDTAFLSNEWVKKDPRFLYFKQQNTGVSAARNFGLSQSKGEWIQFLDADDYLTPSKLKKCIEAYENDNSINFIGCNFKHFTNNISLTTPPFCNLYKEYLNFENILFEWNAKFSFPPHTVFLKKKLIGDTLFPLELTAQEDWYFWVSIFKKKCFTFFIDEPLVLYRSHATSRTKIKSITEDQLKVYLLFKQLLTFDEHNKLSEVLIERYLNKNALLNDRIRDIKSSNSFQTGMMVKKILRSFGMVQAGQRFFPYIKGFKKSKD
ncbi:glycosyltransferase family 2 protein [Zunongwangia sp. F260]|uniref:Glycosyltransferase family 2 protein n=1 Tax=Autumnicola lenta TaxID=3075593 RepID=A0ABU3CG91_9FLAO|nr:glycosyltransferase family 2 protein [Zunongwangia sp. F260]MDT0645311.1 glycosyltransferase family 2 protein [Zunongwangia sp. F260]